jgi:putative ABC transport system permease protein
LINQLVIENLKHRPVRTLLGILAIAIEVAMILTLVGVSRGMLQESARRAQGVGADIWVRPPGSSAISFSSAPMPEALVGYFEKQPGVKIATGSVAHPIGGVDTVTGLDLEKFSRLSGGFKYISGGPFQGPQDIIIDARYAQQKNLKVNDKVKILNRDWRVCGVVEPGKLARIVVPIAHLQELTGTTGKLSQIFVKLDDPKKTDEMVKTFKSQLKEYQIYSIEEFTSLFSINNVSGLREFITIVIALSVIVGFLVVFLSMYTAVLERTREIGILKSLGASEAYIFGLLVRESAVLAVLGSVAGIGLSYFTRMIILHYAGSTLNSVITPDWWPIATAIAIAGAVFGTLYPGFRAVRQDALEALSYE